MANERIPEPAPTPLPDTDKLVAVIPAFNESESVGAVVEGLLQRGITHVRVVDNASTDATARVARVAGAEVISEPTMGYGQACFTGCLDLPPSCEWILFCDADGSDDLDSIPRLLERSVDADFVLGDRRATAEGRQHMTPVQNFGNWLAPSLLNLLFGVRFHDLGPLRLIRRSAYEALDMKDRGFGWTVEMQARAAQLGVRCTEVPVPYHARSAGRSKVSGTIKGSVQAGTIILTTIGRFAVDVWQKPIAAVAAILLIAGALLMLPHGDFRVPEATPRFLIGAAIMSLGFAVSWALRSVGLFVFFSVAIAARLVLLPMEPGGDIWRYVWEGLVQNAGGNPYTLPPNSPELVHLRPDWWSKINHPSITAIYPPFTELVFRVLAFFSPTALAFKFAIIAADLGIVTLLWRRFGNAALIYAWNPLVIYICAGGAHFDSLFLAPLVAGWLLFDSATTERGRVIACALIGLSVALKYLSAPIAAYAILTVWRRDGWHSAFLAATLAGLPLLGSIGFFWGAFGIHPLSPAEFSQLARSAELIPRLVEEHWPKTIKQNSLFVAPFAAIILWRLFRARSLRAFSEEALLTTYVLSPVVHAWYFTWSLPFAVASRNLGLRFVSISAFVYFILEYRQATSATAWRQTPAEAAWLWAPLLLGFAWSRWRERAARHRADRRPPTPVPATAASGPQSNTAAPSEDAPSAYSNRYR
ncbi:MAG: glycosyltransferase [Chthoniobacterales bacterium]